MGRMKAYAMDIVADDDVAMCEFDHWTHLSDVERAQFELERAEVEFLTALNELRNAAIRFKTLQEAARAV
jgi:hypothetical protein